jgi:hypothetical protein
LGSLDCRVSTSLFFGDPCWEPDVEVGIDVEAETEGEAEEVEAEAEAEVEAEVEVGLTGADLDCADAE